MCFNEGFKSFANAVVTIAGVELAHRIHKHQFSFARGRRATTDRSGPTGNVLLHENRLAGRESVGCVQPVDAPEPMCAIARKINRLGRNLQGWASSTTSRENRRCCRSSR